LIDQGQKSDKKINKQKVGKSLQMKPNVSMKRMRDGSRNSVNLNLTNISAMAGIHNNNFSPLANPIHFKNAMSPQQQQQEQINNINMI